MINLVHFPNTEDPEQSMPTEQLGGKGTSLAWMAAQGLNVPPGYILTADFFLPWFQTIMATTEWRSLDEDFPQQWPQQLEILHQRFMALSITPDQQQTLQQLTQELNAVQSGAPYAVRSSSPDEDLGQDSFAGLYQTLLGVRVTDLEQALRSCAASALDPRVLHYKLARGLDPFSPSIALVIQQQIDSSVAGVGFSLNPLTNDFDEVVIEACFGLGEALVGGRIEPDRCVINKLTGQIIDQHIGSKLESVHLDPEGGTRTLTHASATDLALSNHQVAEVSAQLIAIEQAYGHPVDVEWAFSDDQLFILQARPITTWVPLPDSLMSEPGQQRTLYLDAGLSKGFTTNQPISPLGLSVTQEIFKAMGRRYLGQWPESMGPDDVYIVAAGGRLYANLSNSFWLAGPSRMSASMALSDALVARTLADIDGAQYRSPKRPKWARWGALLRVPALIWRMRALIGTALGAFLMPAWVAHRHRKRMQQFDDLMSEIRNCQLPLNELMATYNDRFVHRFMNSSVAILGPALLAQQLIERLVGKRHPSRVALAERLAFGLEGNRVVEMNLALSRIARCLEPSDLEDSASLLNSLTQGTASAPSLAAWGAMIEEFGCRGPNEVDIAQNRYSDDPELLLHQVIGLAHAAETYDPVATHQQQREGRAEALHKLLDSVGPIQRLLIQRFNRVSMLFGGERDTPKHQLVEYLQVLRERALSQGRRCVDSGRLKEADEVFMLVLSELSESQSHSVDDLQTMVSSRRDEMTTLGRQVRNFPSMIDSRGRIPRPPPMGDDPSVMLGMPISAGVVRGTVRIIQTPDQAHIEEGEILVAYTTDPGWTPLFANAAAIVLEVGGCLQHGAVVAREFGKPCVAGIDRVTTRLTDGQQVEVDGGAGTLRVLSE